MPVAAVVHTADFAAALVVAAVVHTAGFAAVPVAAVFVLIAVVTVVVFDAAPFFDFQAVAVAPDASAVVPDFES